jgi:hypothetical protein
VIPYWIGGSGAVGLLGWWLGGEPGYLNEYKQRRGEYLLLVRVELAGQRRPPFAATRPPWHRMSLPDIAGSCTPLGGSCTASAAATCASRKPGPGPTP